MSKIRFTILGQAASKANRRQVVTGPDGRIRVIKNPTALAFEKAALRQIPVPARQMIDVPCAVRLRIFYPNELSDLDESLVLDCLQARYKPSKLTGERVLVQAGVVDNDRRFRVKHVYHAIDRANPRVEVVVWRLDGQQALFDAADEVDSGEVVW